MPLRSSDVGDLHRAGGLGEAFGKGVVDAVVHQDAVGAGAVWPALGYFEAIAPLTAISISASVSGYVFSFVAVIGKRCWTGRNQEFPRRR
jgi:hypothetical protein